MATQPLPETEIDEADLSDDEEGADWADVHQEMMRQFDATAVPQIPMRQEALMSRRFVTIPGAMWEGNWGQQFENIPKPEVDKVTPILEKVQTDYRDNRLAATFIPGDGADPDTANLLNGMLRADSAHFKSQEARDNAFSEASAGGFGAYRLTTDYADPYDPDNDSQRVNPGLPIVDADQSVYFYGGVRYDKSDSLAAFVITAELRQIAEDKGEDDFDDWPMYRQRWGWQWDWYRPDVIYKCEYYKVEDKDDTLLIFTQAQSGEEQRYFKSEIEDGVSADLKAKGWKRRERPIKRKRIRKYIANGCRILKDCGYIAGPNIPIVPVYGRRDFVDNMERFRGIVSKLMDPQRVYNSAVAKVVETNSISPQSTPMVYDEQMSPKIAEEWASRNIDRPAFLRLLALRDGNGEVVSQAQVQMLEAPQVQPAAAALLQIASNDLSDQTDNTDQVPANTSAEAIELAQNRVDAKSGMYLDNMRQSLEREAEIYLGMAREVYYEPGRKVETLTVDDQDGTEELGQPVLGEDDIYRIRNDLTQGKFKVIASVTEATATKRQKAARQFTELAGAFGPGSPDARIMLLNAMLNMDGEGIDETQSWARQQLVAQGVLKPTPEEQQQIEKAQQEKAGQPDSKELALQAELREKLGNAAEAEATADQKSADAELKRAQAAELSKAPPVPTGLSNAPTAAETVDQIAGAKLKVAQANKLEADVHHQRIKTGREIADSHHSQEMERRAADLADRQQSHLESQPVGGE